MIGGEGGIRTPGRLPVNGFQDRRFRPLSHLSEVPIITGFCREKFVETRSHRVQATAGISVIHRTSVAHDRAPS
jgi:hypothetical protein